VNRVIELMFAAPKRGRDHSEFPRLRLALGPVLKLLRSDNLLVLGLLVTIRKLLLAGNFEKRRYALQASLEVSA
jgi:hypothetical protein